MPLTKAARNLEAGPAEAALVIGRAFGQSETEPGEPEGPGIGEHVCSIGQEGKRTGNDSACDLRDHESECQDCGEGYALAGVSRVGDSVMVAMPAMRMRVVVSHVCPDVGACAECQ